MKIIFRKIAYKACFKFRATAVLNSNEFDPQVARQRQGIGLNVEFNSVAPNSK